MAGTEDIDVDDIDRLLAHRTSARDGMLDTISRQGKYIGILEADNAQLEARIGQLERQLNGDD